VTENLKGLSLFLDHAIGGRVFFRYHDLISLARACVKRMYEMGSGGIVVHPGNR
jgi:hypothetical protein